MSHEAAFVVVIVTVAVAPWATLPGALVTLTANAGAAGGSDAGTSDARFSVARGSSVTDPLEGSASPRPFGGLLATPPDEPAQAAASKAMASSRFTLRSVQRHPIRHAAWRHSVCLGQ